MAKRFAKGLANIREPVLVGAAEIFEAADGGETGGEVAAGLGADGAAGLEADGAAGAGAEASSTKSLKAAISDSFSTIIHTS